MKRRKPLLTATLDPKLYDFIERLRGAITRSKFVEILLLEALEARGEKIQ